MSSNNGHNGTLYGTIGGTLLSITAGISSGDIVKTALLATVGAIVSFGVSATLKWLNIRIRRK
jgi:hypothetical protein